MPTRTSTLLNVQPNQIQEYTAVGVTFPVPKPVIEQEGARNMASAIDGVIVVNRDYEFTIDYENYPLYYDAVVASNVTGSLNGIGAYHNGFKSDDGQFRLAVEIPENESIRFIEMSANCIIVVSRKIVSADIVETVRWSNDPYLVNFTFSVNSAGKSVFTNTYANLTGISSPVPKLGRPVRNHLTGKWYLPIEKSPFAGGTGRIYELDEVTGAVVTITSNKVPGGYQLRVPDTINTGNRSTAYTMQGPVGAQYPYPAHWTYRTYLNNPAMFFWKGKMLMLDKDGILNYNTTDMATWQTIAAPSTGAMFYVVDRGDRGERLIAAGLDAATNHQNIVVWELRSITGSWTKIATCVGAGLPAGFTGTLVSENGAVINNIIPNLVDTPYPVPHTDTIVAGGRSTFQYWYPSGTIGIDYTQGITRLMINFAFYHTALYGSGVSTTEDAFVVTTADEYPMMLSIPLPTTESPTFVADSTNTFHQILRGPIKSWAVVPNGSVSLANSYVNMRADYGMIFSRAHAAFVEDVTIWLHTGLFPTLNSNLTDFNNSDLFKFVPTYVASTDFPGNLFATWQQKLLARRMILTVGALPYFYVEGEIIPPSFFANVPKKSTFTGAPFYHSFCEILDAKVLRSPLEINGVNATVSGITSVGTPGEHVIFSGPNCDSLGMVTPGYSTNLIWLLGSNLNRKEPFTLNKMQWYPDPNGTTLFTIVG